jgi:hypothetical protein
MPHPVLPGAFSPLQYWFSPAVLVTLPLFGLSDNICLLTVSVISPLCTVLYSIDHIPVNQGIVLLAANGQWDRVLNCGMSNSFCQARHNSPPDPNDSFGPNGSTVTLSLF